MKNIYLQVLEKQPENSNLVLATVTGTIGSAPQKPGSSALFGMSGLLAGTVGGGMLEGKVSEFAVRSCLSKESGHLHFMLDKDISQKEEAICGGEISVLADADPFIHLPVFREMEISLQNRHPGMLATVVTTDRMNRLNIARIWITETFKPGMSDLLADRIAHEALDRIGTAKPGDFIQVEISKPGESPSAIGFLEPVFPLPHLVIAGAGHIGKALSHLGSLLDFEVTVIDDRSEYANAVNLPDADHIIAGDIGEAMENQEKTSGTYIVIVTRGHKDDANALKPCIGSDASYVGMIGSKTKVAKMQAEFIRQGWATPEQWSRICTPIGLDINSRTVEEIAVSIAAQLVLVRNKSRT
ncbi:MAG: XdhC family protein [Bacteroidales bacterium]|nr:XdhC family protein [Bacteroidales bacterium]